MDWEKLRKEEFPALEDKVYLMAASASPVSNSAYTSVVSYLEEMRQNGDINFMTFFEELGELKSNLAEYINAQENNIAFTISTSSGMNIIAQILEKGEILYPSGEFPASVHIFKRKGFPCIPIPPDLNYIYRIEDFRNKLSENTKHLVHSHIQSFTGFKQNLTALGNFCAENDLSNIINATQSFTIAEIDVREQNIDAMAVNALKWGCCGYGAGILYISEELMKFKNPPVTGWLSVEHPEEMDNNDIYVPRETKRMDSFGGTPNFAALLSLKGSIDLVKRIGSGSVKNGVSMIEERIQWLTSKFLEGLRDLDFNVISPVEEKYRSGIIIIEHNQAKEIHDFLIKHKIFTSLRKNTITHQENLVRFAFHYYNNLSDAEEVIEVLKKMEL